MITSEQLVNIKVRRQVLLERYKTGELQKLKSYLESLSSKTGAIILGIEAERISDLGKAELNSIIHQINGVALSEMGAAVSVFAADLALLSLSEAEVEAESLRSVISSRKVEDAKSDSAYRYALNQPIRATAELPRRYFSRMEKTEAKILESVVRTGWLDGLTVQEMSRRIKGTRAQRFRDGYSRQMNRRVEAQVRTAIQHFASLSHEAVWKANSSIVEGYEWVSTLDSRTTTQCRSLDGQVFQIGQGPRPPIHYNCRSVTVPSMDDEFNFLDTDATRASVRGPVDASETYYTWLKKQPFEFQETALGPTRAKLFADGGISPEKFAAMNIGNDFLPLTLDEMRSANPTAFSKAGL